MSAELTKFESITSIVSKNRPVIQEKIERAINACKMVLVIDTEEQDLQANNLLAKCNATFPVIQGLRKEYTSLIDEWKKSEMAGEKELEKEMDRIKSLRNERANKIAQAEREQKAKIEQARQKELEIVRIKKEQTLAVQIGIAQRIDAGENSITKLFAALTLENFEAQSAKLNITPKLQEEAFRAYLSVSYDKTLVSEDEFKAITEKAFIHFDYAKCDAEYCRTVSEIIKTWKAKLPAKKAELERISKAGAEEAKRLKEEAQKKLDYEANERLKESRQQQEEIQKKASQEAQDAALGAEFNAQIQVQNVETQEGTRGVISYRLANEQNPIKIVEVMGRVMLNVLGDPAFKGIYKRDKAGIPKRDDNGNAEYLDCIQDWLNLLAKIKPSPEFEGVIKTEEVTTVARAK